MKVVVSATKPANKMSYHYVATKANGVGLSVLIRDFNNGTCSSEYVQHLHHTILLKKKKIADYTA
jgi:hypothetical protein